MTAPMLLDDTLTDPMLESAADLAVSNNIEQSAGLTFQSAIYSGWVSHTRFSPRKNHFKYKVFMMYLDLAELEQVFDLSPLWSSTNKYSPARFNRKDFLGNPNTPLDVAVKQRIAEETGNDFTGSIRVLCNLRYFGYSINPITCYYCFDEEERLKYIVAEVTNTPWGERHSYVLACRQDDTKLDIKFEKMLHVSPFNPMDMNYHWVSIKPADSLRLSLDTLKGEERVLNASLVLQREEISGRLLNKKVIRYPLMTVKVVCGIYWQALKLFVKGLPFYANKSSVNKLDTRQM